MFRRKCSLLFFLTVSVTFLFFSNTTNEASPSLKQKERQTIGQIKALTKIGPGIDDPDVKIQKLAEKIQKDYADLKRLFDNEENNFGQKMAKILGKKATIVFDDEKIRGKEKIKKFWEEAGENYQSVEFRLNWAVIFFEKITEEKKDYDHIAYEAFEFHLYRRSEGKILENQTGRGERSCRHIYDCECITR